MQVASKVAKGFSLFFMVVLFTGCVQQNFKPTKTSVELQAMQAKDFETAKEVAFASTMSTFQDLGYKVASADLATGFISAEGPTEGKFVPFIGQVMETLKATAFVESMGKNRAKIRLNFVNEMKSSSGYGMSGGNSVPVEEPQFYQDAFAKITKGIYLRENMQ